MRIRNAVEIEDPGAGAEASNRKRRIKAGYRRLFRGASDEGRGGRLSRSAVDGKGRKPKAVGEIPESPVNKPSGHPVAPDYLSRFLCVGFVLALAVTGCVGPRPLKGGKAVVTRSPGGSVQQTLTQSENPAQATRQEQESVKMRTYTVPAGSRVEQSSRSASHAPGYERNGLLSLSLSPSKGARVPKAGEGTGQPSILPALPPGCGGPGDPPLPTSIALSAPMQVVEREETRERTELGAAQKDMAREVGAKLASLKGIVWVGVGLFIFGLASLVYPPLKVVIGSVTTSAALMLGGVALMVLPSLVVGNEMLILGGVALVVGAWFLAHRHGQLKGEASSLKFKV